jgi:NAD-dependent DNA ligase
MPPKKAAAASSVYVVVLNGEVNSIYASEESAHAHLDSIKADSAASSARIEVHVLKGGSVTPHAVKVVSKDSKDGKDAEAEAEAPKTKAKATKKSKGDDEGDNAETTGTSKPNKTGAQNAKAKAIEDSLPGNVKALLDGSGSVLSGLAIVVTGVPPTLGRQNAERLVLNYGGKLAKSISKNTNYVVVGREAGPKKLEQILDLGIQTMSEDELIEMLEGGGGVKRGAEEPEEPAAKKVKT